MLLMNKKAGIGSISSLVRHFYPLNYKVDAEMFRILNNINYRNKVFI